MNIRILMIALVAAVFGGVVGVLGFVWFVGGDGAASASVTAPTLDINALPTLNPTQAFAAVTQVAQLSTQVADLQATSNAVSQPATPIPAVIEATPVPPTEAAAGEVEALAAIAGNETSSPPGRTLYRIDPTISLVTFALQEDLRGQRTDVVGTTREVAGDIIVDFATPANSQIGTIRINARTLVTDSEFRNRALRSEILQSSNEAYEFIEFVPTAITGLPASVSLGETYPAEIAGDLTIAGQTRSVTFATEVTLASETRLMGVAQTVVRYADWGISIPNAPGVANVTEEVTLKIEFVANQTEA